MDFTRKQRLLLATVPPVASTLIRLLGSTLRFRDVCDPGVTPGHLTPAPGVFGFWHRSLLMAAYRFRNMDIAILISQSFDGELIARTVELLGFTAIRGSSSRGGAVALLQLQTAIESGHFAAFTADGPRGPVYVAKPGLTLLAQRTTGDAGAFHLHPLRAWQLKTWDRFLIPKPFTTVIVSWPSHTMLHPDEPTATAHQRTQHMMARATTLAEKTFKNP